jgi:hypothetical protein
VARRAAPTSCVSRTPTRLPLLADYAAFAEEVLSGASPVAPIFFRFDGAIDLERLPDPAGSLAEPTARCS